jgi:hypothetical protein
MFALVMVGEFYRRDGWDTWIEPDPQDRNFVELIRGEWFDLVEFLASGDRHLDPLAASIRMIRRESPNRALGVVLRGRAFVENPELLLLVGGDTVAGDVTFNALQAQDLVRLVSCRN